MQFPLVSVIVPTKNSSTTLEACLTSIKKQTYPNIEIIIVDNFSTDDTAAIARRFTIDVYSRGPERSAQRNYGVEQAHGEYVAIIDSDMELSPSVIAECVEQMQNSTVAGVVIPEESFGEGFWAQCKKLERSFYVGVPWMEAARFFRRAIYLEEGGYNVDLVSGEDWELSQRVAKHGTTARVPSFIYHNEGHINLFKTIRKKYYYAQHFGKYVATGAGHVANQTSLVGRYALFLSKPGKLLRNPLLGIGMLFMKTCEFGAGAFGIVNSRK